MEGMKMAGYDEMAKQKARRAIRAIARSQRVSEAEVRAEMEIAMMAGYNNPDPAVQAEWAKAPFGNRVPTVEEFLTWIASRIVQEV